MKFKVGDRVKTIHKGEGTIRYVRGFVFHVELDSGEGGSGFLYNGISCWTTNESGLEPAEGKLDKLKEKLLR